VACTTRPDPAYEAIGSALEPRCDSLGPEHGAQWAKAYVLATTGGEP